MAQYQVGDVVRILDGWHANSGTTWCRIYRVSKSFKRYTAGVLLHFPISERVDGVTKVVLYDLRGPDGETRYRAGPDSEIIVGPNRIFQKWDGQPILEKVPAWY